MCKECEGMSRREFIGSLIVGGMGWLMGGNRIFMEIAHAAGKTHIRFSTWHPPASREVRTVWIPMLEKLKEESNGEITYTMYAGGALGKGPEHYDIVAKGLSDMGYFTATWTPGRFPLTDVLSSAVWIDGKDLATDIGNAVYERILKDEFTDVKVIELNPCIQSFIWTRKPVRKLEDLKGLKLRSLGGMQTKYIKALGAEPIFMPLGDVYMAIQMGTIDGLVTCPPLVCAFKLYEVIRYGVELTLGCASEGVVANLKWWNKVPDAHKKLIEELCSNPFRTSGGLTRKVYKEELIPEITKAGVELIKFSEADLKECYLRFQDVTRMWVKELEGKGLPASKAVQIMYEECEKRGVEMISCPPELRSRV